MTRKERLVVIGNGMAGARFVEEVLARGGGDRFDIVMFGDEPYGNYNRILLSSVLAGTHAQNEIFSAGAASIESPALIIVGDVVSRAVASPSIVSRAERAA